MSNFLHPWVVDEERDAEGHWTVRVADGTENGNTEEQPVATFYGRYNADKTVALHNAMLPVIDARRTVITVDNGVLTFENGESLDIAP